MTTESKKSDKAEEPVKDSNAIETSVDADVLSLDEKIAAMQAERSDLAAKQSEERAAKQTERFEEIVGGPSEILGACGIDLDALKAIGVTGFILQVKPDADGGADIVSVAPVTARAAAKKATTKKSGGSQRDLGGNFDANANAEEKAAMDAILADGNDGNKAYSLKVKVWDRVHAS